MQHVKLVTAVYAEPFSALAPKIRQWPEGMSLAEIVAAMDVLPAGFVSRGEIRINGDLIDRDLWHRVKPKAASVERPVAVTFHMAPRGGRRGGGGGKQIIGLVAALALTVATGGIAGGALATSGGLFAAGTLSAKVLAGAVGLVGALAIGALTAPPSVKAGETGGSVDDNRTASASGNDILRPGGTLDRVVGTSKVFPKYAGEPVNSLVGNTQDEEIEAVVVLDGPHHLDDIRANGEPLESSEDTQVQIREGWADDPLIDLVTRYGKRTGTQIELSRHLVNPEQGHLLLDQAVPERSLPKFHGVPTGGGPDEVWLRLAAAGLRFNSNDNQISVPFRLQIRRRGAADWINLPEFHISNSTNSPYKFEVRLLWDSPAEPEIVLPAPTKDGVTAAYVYALAQTADPPSPDQTVSGTSWVAHSYFDSWPVTGKTQPGIFSGVEGSSRLAHTQIFPNRIEFYLDSAVFPKGLYDVRVKRGFAYNKGDFSYSAYTLNGSVNDFFWYYKSADGARIRQTRENITDQVSLLWGQSIWNKPILPKPGYAAIAIKARNKELQSISTVASGYVRDWDGTGWNNWVHGSEGGKLAAHFRDVKSGDLNPDPMPLDLWDEEEMLAWRQDCADKGYYCNEVFSQQSIDDILTLIASCGYARPYQSEIHGVIRDRDRTNDPVVQVFTPRTARGFSFQKAFAKRPDGFIVTFRNRENDYQDDEVIVFRDGYEGGEEGGDLETVTYGGLDHLPDVIKRAEFDLAQAEARSTFYRWEAPAEGIVCRRGSLAVLEHDILSRQTGRARIKSVTAADGFVTALKLDSVVPVRNTPDVFQIADIFAVEDVFDIGLRTAISIRRTNGVLTTHLTKSTIDAGETDEIVLDAALDDRMTPGSVWDVIDGRDEIPEIDKGCAVTTGLAQHVFTRVIVHEMRPKADMTIDFVGVDEAPELHGGVVPPVAGREFSSAFSSAFS